MEGSRQQMSNYFVLFVDLSKYVLLPSLTNTYFFSKLGGFESLFYVFHFLYLIL